MRSASNPTRRRRPSNTFHTRARYEVLVVSLREEGKGEISFNHYDSHLVSNGQRSIALFQRAGLAAYSTMPSDSEGS